MKKVYSFLSCLALFSTLLKAQVATPVICMVTVDDSSYHNIVYYDKTAYTNADSFFLWRETTPSFFVRILAQRKNAMSLFLDTAAAGNPNSALHRYKLQFHDSVLNAYSPLSDYHTSMFCLQSTTNYNWNLYAVENTGSSMVLKYKLMQDNFSNNVWHAIDSMTNTTIQATESTITGFPYARWRLFTEWSISCTPTAREGNPTDQNTIIRSKSNITNNRTSGIREYHLSSNLYPNPATSQVTLRFNFPVSSQTNIVLYNALGAEAGHFVVSQGKDEIVIPVSNYPEGVYFIKIGNTGGESYKKLVIH